MNIKKLCLLGEGTNIEYKQNDENVLSIYHISDFIFYFPLQYTTKYAINIIDG